MENKIEVKAAKQMAFIVKMEEIAITAISIYLLTIFNLGLPAWIWALLFFIPDLSILAYFLGTSIGAFIYNLVHHRGIALIVVSIGIYLNNDTYTAAGILLFSHSSFDRMMGYGLKFSDDFKHTSLGWMGNSKPL